MFNKALVAINGRYIPGALRYGEKMLPSVT